MSAFYINIAGIHGRHSVCIECTTANRRLRRQRDDYPALAKQRHIDYYAKNKQRVIERTRKYREDRPVAAFKHNRMFVFNAMGLTMALALWECVKIEMKIREEKKNG